MTLDIAARVSTGQLAGRFRCPQGRVLVVNTEDDLRDTVEPRLLEAGADEARIKVYQCMTDRETGETSAQPAPGPTGDRGQPSVSGSPAPP